mmetsp:Transcript_20583/g.64808  ORF Transcript_20583/g.64808 Transcript_20583/m.64808 type:complete len:451 (-) Transcript_20583:1171-2523(-)
MGQAVERTGQRILLVGEHLVERQHTAANAQLRVAVQQQRKPPAVPSALVAEGGVVTLLHELEEGGEYRVGSGLVQHDGRDECLVGPIQMREVFWEHSRVHAHDGEDGEAHHCEHAGDARKDGLDDEERAEALGEQREAGALGYVAAREVHADPEYLRVEDHGDHEGDSDLDDEVVVAPEELTDLRVPERKGHEEDGHGQQAEAQENAREHAAQQLHGVVCLEDRGAVREIRQAAADAEHLALVADVHLRHHRQPHQHREARRNNHCAWECLRQVVEEPAAAHVLAAAVGSLQLFALPAAVARRRRVHPRGARVQALSPLVRQRERPVRRLADPCVDRAAAGPCDLAEDRRVLVEHVDHRDHRRGDRELRHRPIERRAVAPREEGLGRGRVRQVQLARCHDAEALGYLPREPGMRAVAEVCSSLVAQHHQHALGDEVVRIVTELEHGQAQG